jgi:O-antigen/teichoic acid export membrane protein
MREMATTTTTTTTPQEAPTVARLASNTIVQAIGIPLQSLISLGTYAAITRYLGPSAFGDYTTATVYLLIPIAFADIGLSAIVVREISSAPERANAILRASYSLRLIISAAAVAVTVGSAFVLPFDHRARVAIIIMAFGAFLSLVNLSVLPILQVQLRMQWAVFANLTGRAVTLVATLAVLALGLGFKAVVTANVIGLGAILLVDLWAVRSAYSLRPSIDAAYWKRFLKASLVLGVGLAVSQVYFRVDTVLIALLRPASEVGLYGAAYKFIELTQGLVFTVFISLFPTLTSFAARRDARFSSLAQKGFDVVVAAALPLTLAMAFAARPLLEATAGNRYGAAASALQILALYPLVAFANGLLWRILIATHKERILLAVALTILALNVVLNLVFIPLYGYKAAAVTSIASEACSLAVGVVVVRRYVGFLPRLDYLPVVLFAGLVMAGLMLVLPIERLVAAVLAGVVYVLLLVLLPGTARLAARELMDALGAAVTRRRSAQRPSA